MAQAQAHDHVPITVLRANHSANTMLTNAWSEELIQQAHLLLFNLDRIYPGGPNLSDKNLFLCGLSMSVLPSYNTVFLASRENWDGLSTTVAERISPCDNKWQLLHCMWSWGPINPLYALAENAADNVEVLIARVNQRTQALAHTLDGEL